jgi:hypothetical protein
VRDPVVLVTSNDIGKDTERLVVRYLRDTGWPGAERTVRTGYHVVNREMADQGDIDGTPGLCWQVKSLRPSTRMELAVPGWLVETDHQREASGATLGFLVVRRWGTTDVGRWWTFQSAWQLYTLLDSHTHLADRGDVGRLIPIRMDMAALVGLLHQTGWAGTTTDLAQEATS